MKKDNQKEQSKKEKPAANKTAAKATDDKDTARNQYSGSGGFGSDDNETTNTKDGQLNKGKTIVDSQVPETETAAIITRRQTGHMVREAKPHPEETLMTDNKNLLDACTLN